MIALRPSLSFLSFLLYAAAALIGVHEHPSAWTLEHEDSLPAAISHAVYGTRIGLFDSNVRNVFIELRNTGLTPPGLSGVQLVLLVACRR